MEFEDLNVMFGYESKLIFLHPDNCTLTTAQKGGDAGHS